MEQCGDENGKSCFEFAKNFFVSSWIVVDGLGPQTLLTTQNQLMIAAMKTWEAIAEFWPDLPRIMDLIRQRK